MNALVMCQHFIKNKCLIFEKSQYLEIQAQQGRKSLKSSCDMKDLQLKIVVCCKIQFCRQQWHSITPKPLFLPFTPSANNSKKLCMFLSFLVVETFHCHFLSYNNFPPRLDFISSWLPLIHLSLRFFSADKTTQLELCRTQNFRTSNPTNQYDKSNFA